MREKPYKIGVIGAGIIAEFSHLPVLKNIADVKVEWVFDKNTERSKLLSDMYQIAFLHDAKLHEGINDVDICLLTVPLGTRLPYIKTCSEKNKALYVEKPFATGITEHEKYCSFFPNYKLAVGFQRRYYKVVTVIKSIIETKIFGNLSKINITQGNFILKGDKKYLSDAKLSGGGVIIESAIHILDQILIITAANSVKVTSLKTLQQNGIDYDSIFTSIITTATGEITVNAEITTLRNLKNIIEFHFDYATLQCTLTQDSNIVIGSKNRNTSNFTIDKFLEKHNECLTSTSISGSFNIFWTQFINALDTQTVNLTSGISSLITTSWIQDIYKYVNKK